MKTLRGTAFGLTRIQTCLSRGDGAAHRVTVSPLYLDMTSSLNCISLLITVFSLLLSLLLFQYDVVPIQPSVVICSCSHPSMVRNHPDSCSPLAIPGASSSHCPSMEGSASEARAVGASASSQGSDLRAQSAVPAPQPRKKKPEDFRFGKILGEGSFSTVRSSHSTFRIMNYWVDVATC